MKAKQMFRNLGYDTCILPNENDYVKRYIHEENDSDIMIDFLSNREIIKHDGNGYDLSISMNELRAINQQCKELGWILW